MATKTSAPGMRNRRRIMSHPDALSLRMSFHSRGQSLFARPVAAITSFVRRHLGKSQHAPAPPRIAQDLEVRAIEESLDHASDLADLERMQRAYDRRDA